MKNCFSVILAGSILLASAGNSSDKNYMLSDNQIQIQISIQNDSVIESEYAAGNIELSGMVGSPWQLETSDGMIKPTGVQSVNQNKKNGSIDITGTTGQLNWKLRYEISGPGRIMKSLKLIPQKDIVLKRVSMWNVSSPNEPVVSRTPMQDIAAFYRKDGRGIFASLDFPYSKINTKDSVTSIMYPPHEKLSAGKEYIAHTLTFGATALNGEERYGFDTGEVDAVDSYIQERFKPRFNRPMFTSCCMNNRYTQVENNYVFYTMYDHPTLNFHKDLYKRDIKLMRDLSMEYYQVFPGVFDWVPGDPDPKVVKELMDYSRKIGMRTGDYSTASGLFCGHYNEYGNTMNKPEWRIKDQSGNVTGLFSLGVPEYVDYYIETVVKNGKKYGFEVHNLDFVFIQADYDKEKSAYPAGEENVYHQVKGFVRLLEAINSISPNMMTWSNSGNCVDFLPKIAWFNHNLYLTDPYIDKTWQGLNMTRLLDDARREQMVSLHYSRFIPYRYFTNYQYFFSQNSIVPDVRNYQYGALSTLAVTPNIGLGDIRPWLDKMPESVVTDVKAFYKKWTTLVKRNYKLWTKTYHTENDPGMGGVEVYSHADKDHGFIFLVNPQYWDKTVDIPLDSKLGFSADGKCEVVELHPTEQFVLTDQGPFASYGSVISMNIPAQQVIVLEIKPAPSVIAEPKLYGIPGSIEITDEGYLVKTTGNQGTNAKFTVLLPDDVQKAIQSVSVRQDVPKQAKRLYADTPIKLLKSDDRGATIEFTYRRTPSPNQLREWEARKGSIDDGTVSANWTAGFTEGEKLRFPLFIDRKDSDIKLPMWDADADKMELGALSNFCGAYIDNAFSEMQETWIELKTSNTGSFLIKDSSLDDVKNVSVDQDLPALAKDTSKSWWLQTKVNIPFMYWAGGMEPGFDDHTILVLPTIRQNRIKTIKAWVNGAPLTVLPYKYPRNRSLACYYADLVGTAAHGGDNTIVVYFEMMD